MKRRSPRRGAVTLVTGASGYIGTYLKKRLEAEGHRIRCVSRHPEKLSGGPRTEVAYGDMLEPGSLGPVMEGVGVAYYLVHSMASAGNFVEQDRLAARNFGEAARRAGVSRIIYLGGIASADDLSDHLESRLEVGQILRESGVPTVEFRASIIIGPGSLSFEMIRALVDKLPIMITPRWVRQRAQPIAIEDVVAYLASAHGTEPMSSTVYEIGGATRATYQEIMNAYARRRGLKRFMIPVPVLTPRLSSLWLGLVTPAQAVVGRKLVDSLRNDTVVGNDDALSAFRVVPRDLATAIDDALTAEDADFRARHWSTSMDREVLGETHETRQIGRRIVDSRSIEVDASPGSVFVPVRRIGGETGWYAANFLWKFRGTIDRVLGGPGLGRGRKDPETVQVGDVLDFWRVEALDPGRRLRLRAEMKVPGRAWLQFEVNPCGRGARLRQTAEFDPSGVVGLLYWYALYPIHQWIFRKMLHRMGEAAREVERTGDVPPEVSSRAEDVVPAPRRRAPRRRAASKS